MLRINAEEGKLGEEVIRHIVESRFRQKKNTFIAICGGVGEGKSYASLRIAEIIDDNFNVKEQVVYYPQQFLQVIEKARKGNFKVIILDEAHVTVPSRLWYSFSNLAVSMVATTFRQVKNLVVILNSPNVNWLERQLREMVNYYGVVFRKEGSPVYLKLYKVGFNYFNLQDQQPFLQRIVFSWNGKPFRLNVLKIGLPKEETMKDYEELSLSFKGELIEKNLSEVLRKIEKSVKVANLEEIASTLLENEKLLSSVSSKRKNEFKLNKVMVKKLFRLTDNEIQQLEDRLKEKMKSLGWI